MKTFDELGPEEQDRAVQYCLNRLLKAVTEGAIRFDDEINGDDLQARIELAGVRAEAMRTPWFAHECVMEAVGEELSGMARCEAEDSLYAEPTENVIAGVIRD